jgi:hypothetical protein
MCIPKFPLFVFVNIGFSNLDAWYHDRDFHCVSSVRPGKVWDYTLKRVTATNKQANLEASSMQQSPP